MSISKDLFLSILAMDSYNRGGPESGLSKSDSSADGHFVDAPHFGDLVGSLNFVKVKK